MRLGRHFFKIILAIITFTWIFGKIRDLYVGLLTLMRLNICYNLEYAILVPTCCRADGLKDIGCAKITVFFLFFFGINYSYSNIQSCYLENCNFWNFHHKAPVLEYFQLRCSTFQHYFSTWNYSNFSKIAVTLNQVFFV